MIANPLLKLCDLLSGIHQLSRHSFTNRPSSLDVTIEDSRQSLHWVLLRSCLDVWEAQSCSCEVDAELLIFIVCTPSQSRGISEETYYAIQKWMKDNKTAKKIS